MKERRRQSRGKEENGDREQAWHGGLLVSVLFYSVFFFR